MANIKSRNNDKAQQQLQVAHAEIAATYSGPIPDANQLGRYEQVSPGAADRIISMAEKQSAHRQEIEKIVVNSGAKNSTMGVVFAFIIGIIAISGGVFLASSGHEISGSVIGGTGLIGLVSVFVYGTRSNKNERAERRNQR